MDRAAQVCLSVVVWAAWGVLVVAWTPVVAVLFAATAWWDRGRWVVGRTFRLLARLALAANPLWSVDVSGAIPARRSHPYVMVCNHQSLADPILVGSLPWEAKWIAKRSVFWIPFLGAMMWMAGDVRVRRRDPDSRSRAYERLAGWLRRGASVMIFPEGTRSEDGRLLPFRNGAFRLAVETGTPVLPLAVAGTRQALRKGSLVFGRAAAAVAVLEPVAPPAGEDAVERLRDDVRDRIREAVRRLPAGSAP